MQQVTETIQQVEDIQAKFSYGINMLVAIHDAILHGDNAPGDYSGALFGACDYLDGLNDELAEVIGKHYDDLRAADSSNDKN